MRNAAPIAIVGAGIAGLTMALCLARHGLDSEIFEQAEALEEVGAGLQLSPNASRILIELGLLQALREVWSEPDSITLADGRSLRTLARVPAGAEARSRWAAPYGVLHRASLQRILREAVQSEPRCRLNLGHRIEGFPGPAVMAETGRQPQVIVGADGIRSQVRAALSGGGAVHFSGNVAWRLMVPRALAANCLSDDRVTAFLAPNAHLVAYPIREMDSFNLVAIVGGRPTDERWAGQDSEGRRRELAASFRHWNAGLRSMLDDAASATCWPLCTVDDGAWQNGRDTVLIGDAAHAMTPFAAQGAAMAIEDAHELAHCLMGCEDIASALRRYEAVRRPRIDRVRKRGAFNQFAYHARGPIQVMRNAVLALRGPEALAADLDWLYGYGAPGR